MYTCHHDDSFQNMNYPTSLKSMYCTCGNSKHNEAMISYLSSAEEALTNMLLFFKISKRHWSLCEWARKNVKLKSHDKRFFLYFLYTCLNFDLSETCVVIFIFSRFDSFNRGSAARASLWLNRALRPLISALFTLLIFGARTTRRTWRETNMPLRNVLEHL